MADSQELKILLRTVADLTGINEVKGGIQATTAEVEAASAATSGFGSVLAGALGGAAVLGVGALVGALIQIPSLISQAAEEEERFNQKIDQSSSQLDTQIAIWDQLASHASTFNDVVAIGMKGVAELGKLTAELNEAESRKLSTFQKTVDFFSTHLLTSGDDQLGGKSAPASVGIYQGGNDADVTRIADLRAAALKRLTDAEREATAGEERFQEALNNPSQGSLDEYNSQLRTAEGILASIDPTKSVANHAAYVTAENDVKSLRGQVDQLQKANEKAATSVEHEAESRKKIQADLALKGATASGDSEAIAAARGNAAYEQTLRTLGDIHGLKAANVALAEQERQKTHDLALDQLNSKGATSGARADHQSITAFLREEATIIQGIHQQQQLIAQSPFLGIDAKVTQTAALIVQEVKELNIEVLKGRALIKGGTLDPATYQQIERAIDQAIFKMKTLQQQASTLNFAGSLKKDLTDWVNSFGTAGQQIGQALQGSVNAALQGTNQLLTGLIDGTGNWKQTLVGVEKQIANVFLTWVEQMALQKGAQLLGITTTTGAQVASGASIAAAHAPAAAATSISSYGAAAVVGEVLAVAAIAAIIAALAGGFAEGGVIPGPPSSRDNRLAMVATGEGILTASAVQKHGGKSFVDAINYGRLAVPQFALGGTVGSLGSGSSLGGRSSSSAPQLNQALFYDIRKARQWLFDQTGKKEIRDITHGPRRTVHR